MIAGILLFSLSCQSNYQSYIDRNYGDCTEETMGTLGCDRQGHVYECTYDDFKEEWFWGVYALPDCDCINPSLFGIDGIYFSVTD